jgi:predicted alpha/beta superfamily hydrolase
MAQHFILAGQNAYYHNEGHDSGYFHTYDGLQLSPNDCPRKVHVFLPQKYEESDRFPVVYMNDGNTAFCAGGLSPYSWEVPRVLSELYNQEVIRPVIVVAIHPLNRSHEYLHVQEFSALFKKEGGGLPEYGNYVFKVKQFIDKNYRTLSDRKHTTLIGSSHGGLASFYIGCVHGRYFGNIAALSPSFWAGGVFNLSESLLVQTVKKFLSPDNCDRPRIWIDWGMKRSDGFHNFFIEAQASLWGHKMIELLKNDYSYVQGIDLFKYVDIIGGHDELAWSHRLGLVLKQFYKS